MKKILLAALVLIALTAKGQKKENTIRVKVDYVLRYEDGTGEVWAKLQSKYNKSLLIYYAAFYHDRKIPDSLVRGKVITLRPEPLVKDTCDCIEFKRMK